jgi:hypothetical protein
MTRRETFRITPSEVERLLFHWPVVMQRATTDFARGFSSSIAKQSRRRGWTPSTKQLAIMRELVSDLFAHAPGHDLEDDFDLIES